MPNTHTPVEVTQADREAAASLWISVDGDIPTPVILNEAERYRQGVYDHTPAVQSFARHRIETTRAVDTELLEALELAVSYGWQHESALEAIFRAKGSSSMHSDKAFADIGAAGDHELTDAEVEAALAVEGITTWGPDGERFERMFAAAMKRRAAIIKAEAGS